MMKRPLPNKIGKVLIIRMSSIGDIILATPVIHAIQHHYPDARIDFLVRREYGDILRHDPAIHQLIELDTRLGQSGLRALRYTIQDNGYDLIIDLHRNLRSRYLCRFPGRPPLLAVSKNQLIRFLWVHFKINRYPRPPQEPLSVMQKYLLALAPLGIDPSGFSAALHLAPEAETEAESRWQALAGKGYYVAIAPGARHATKRWPPAYYSELIQQIFEKYQWRTVLLGGPDEAALLEEIRGQAGQDIAVNLAGDLSLPESFAIIRRSGIFISNDSGLMHAAAAFNRPQIAIFGSTTRELGFFPTNELAVIAENQTLSCRPCSHIGRSSCPKGHFKCMNELTPEMVFKMFQKLASPRKGETSASSNLN